jgi:hypothetical protein
MKIGLKALLVAASVAFAGQAAAQITLFHDDGFQGEALRSDRPIDNFANSGYNDEASSAIVRGGSWQACSDAYFEGRCVVLAPGRYPSLRSLGLNDRISSVRPVEQYGRRYDEGDRYAERPFDHSYGDRYYGPRERY